MKFAVINGSPKGDNSITLQTVRYLAVLNPQHSFEILNAAQGIHGLKKDFSRAEKVLSDSDAVIFSYPVYTFMAPSQLHEFIRLMKNSSLDFSGKYATQITTSKHFYDVTAHRYIEENCADFGMKYVRGLSADMDDLTSGKGQKEARSFFDYFIWCIENGIFEPSAKIETDYTPCEISVPSSCKKTGGDTVIVTDSTEEDISLNKMIERFRAVYTGNTRVINLNEAGIKGGCLGCLHCAVSGKCVYADGFDGFLRNEIQSADATVYAFTVRDHSMGTLFKTYDDRQFCNGHRTVTAGKPVAYLVSGKLSSEENLKMIIKARSQAGGNYLCGIATDENNTETEIGTTAKRLAYAIENSYTQPADFYGVGGMKIFRDLIYLMRGMMKADHKFYKQNGLYDFPQKKKGTSIAMYLVGAMFGNEKIMAKGSKYMSEGMLMPYTKILREAEKEVNAVND